MAANKVTVRIWMPTDMGIKGQLASYAGVGHASLTLRVDDRKHYITWMADGSPFEASVLAPYKKIESFTKAMDKRNMQNFFNSAEPTHKIKLKTRQPNEQTEGLDANLIEAFWLERLKNKPKYSFISASNNCTGCVADALRAGGLGQYARGSKPWIVQDAASLLAWVLAAEKRLKGAADEVDEDYTYTEWLILNHGMV
ncbi:hypothetical protein SAMN05445504_3624 [Burkholderia sp. CF099]|nr:hypothetical protein SAMN05445504_3624 [Burkholderia sp. CF099]